MTLDNLKTWAVLNSCVPPSWRTAEVAIGWSEDTAMAVHSIELRQNSDGRRIVVLHKNPLEVKGGENE